MGSFSGIITKYHIFATLQAILLGILGYYVARIISKAAPHLFKKKLSAHQAMLFRRVIFYVIFLLFLISAIEQLGFRITALLGATGIITVAIGIASQTSMSNVVSGLFIIGEKPFQLGDTIKINDIQGEVIGIDYLSVKIRTNDNTMIRIPNETLLKTPVTNLSYFPRRRLDLTFNLPFQTNLAKLKELLTIINDNNKFSLKDPAPIVILNNLTENGLNVQFSVWAEKAKYYDVKTSIQTEINKAFLTENIDLSASRIYTFQTNTPLPIQLMPE